MSRPAAKGADDQVKLKKILDELTKREENKFCADCGCRGPRWASINLGVFICIACSGIHRSLGVHLTFVRSVNLDSWTGEQVAQMQKWGNARAKAYYEANVPRDFRTPNEQSSVRDKEMWIRDKYERKRFIAREEPPEGAPDRRTGSSSRRKNDSDDEDDRRRSGNSNARTGSSSRSNDRTGSSSRRPEPTPTKPAVATQDILSFDVFSAPAPAPAPTPAPAAAPQQQQAAPPKQDEWASFSGSSSTSQGFNDAFAAPAQPTAQAQRANAMANIMANFGPAPSAMPPPNPFGGAQPGMMAPAPMGMNPMGGAPMGMNPMGGMGMMPPQPGFGMNPMMQQNPMGGMGMPMGGAPMGMNPMMGGGMFPGGPAPGMGFPQQPQPGMGFPQQPQPGMGMNPMMGGGMGFPQQQQPRGPMGNMAPQMQQQQQQQAGGLNQPFVNLQGGKNPFF